MGISLERARRHIRENTDRLRTYPRNTRWPQCLFHAAQMEVAIAILRQNAIVPRGQQERLIHDVANPDAVANNLDSHKYARFYFRPKNSFHLKTEGIKTKDDPNRQSHHMSIPVMLVFCAESILCLPQSGFTAGCGASMDAIPEFTEEAFDRIVFKDVYHDYAPPPERGNEIRFRRMAEVMHYGKAPVRPYLRYIVFRTQYDRTTFFHHFPDIDDELSKKCIVEQIQGSNFFHSGLYIQKMYATSKTLTVELHPPRRLPPSGLYSAKIRVDRECGGRSEIHGDPSTARNRFRINYSKEVTSNSIWEIWLENCLAFKGKIPIGSEII